MTIFFRLLETDDKGTALHEAIQQLAQQQPNPNTFVVEPESFQQVPGAPFAYWVSEEVRNLFVNFQRLENSDREARIGPSTGDDTRYIRVVWEVPLDQIGRGIRWVWLNKGGSASAFYFGYHLVIDWDEERRTFRSFCGRIGRPIERPNGLEHFFRPGLTWPSRTNGLSVRALPQSFIFSHKGSSVFVQNDIPEEMMALCAIMNSQLFNILVSVQLARTELAQSFEVGLIQQTPVPDLTSESTTILATLARRAWSLKRSLDTITQTSHAFVLPALLQVNGSSLTDRAQTWADHIAEVEANLTQIQAEIDELAFELYGIGESDRIAVSSQPIANDSGEGTDDDDESLEAIADPLSLTKEMLAYVLGVAIGRFDVRLVTGDRELPAEPEPFDPLPVCSPGMLVDETGLPPTEVRSLPADYVRWQSLGEARIDIPFNGIFVDDEGHPNDIIRHVREVLKVIWGDADSDIEQEACAILKVSSLRDYFRKPALFFNDHLSRYSKSRRQAPIYLPLSTASGSYTLWLYYHRLTDQTLYTCINDYVEPKLSRVSETVKFLRSKTSRSRDEENDLETLQTLEDDLTKFRDELLRVAKLPWKPNLNDGVQITVAPLHSLFRLSKWQKKLKETWDKLEKGDYDWAHLAHSIWTARVREKCRTDKSLAIAHSLETLYEPPPETPKRTKREKKE